jgi:hypothetical protein
VLLCAGDITAEYNDTEYRTQAYVLPALPYFIPCMISYENLIQNTKFEGLSDITFKINESIKVNIFFLNAAKIKIT